MSKRVAAGVALLLALGLPLAHATSPVPRESPSFNLVEPAGGAIELSQYKGQVVLLEFLLVKCQRCVGPAQMLSKLHTELGPRGFQPIGVAFDKGVVSDVAVDGLVHSLALNYPVGTTTSDKVDRYLGRGSNEFLQVPQMVLIDRAGMIRAQSKPVGEANLQDEAFLRNLIQQLLDEPAPAGKSG